jgi:AraC-like DNA-binding protein
MPACLTFLYSELTISYTHPQRVHSLHSKILTENTPLITIRAEILIGYSKLVLSLGGNPEVLLRQANLSPAQLSHPDNRINYQAVCNLFRLSAEACHEPLFGFRFAREQTTLSLGIVGQLARTCPDIRTAMREITNHFLLHSEAGSWRAEEDGELTYLIRQERQKAHYRTEQNTLYTITQTYRLLRLFCGGEWRPKLVIFDKAISADTKDLKQFFRAPLQFDGNFPGFVISSSDLNRPIATADLELRLILDSYVQGLMDAYVVDGDLRSKVRILIEQTLSLGRCTAPLIADMLSLHVQTLRRGLEAEGTGFKALLTEVQLERAMYHMQNSTRNLTEIASLLGYSELSSFTRAFKAQTGFSPTAWQLENP